MSENLIEDGITLSRYGGGEHRGICYQIEGSWQIPESGRYGNLAQLETHSARRVAVALLVDLARRGEFNKADIQDLGQTLHRMRRRHAAGVPL